MKKVLSIVLTIALMLSITPLGLFNVTANAESSNDNADYEYAVISETDKTASLTNYTGTDTHLVIPSNIDGYKIVEIGYGFCEKNEELRSVIISDGIIDIRSYAFNRCSRLKDITIPPSVKKMGYDAFGQNGIRYENGSVNISDLYSWFNIEFSDFSIYSMFVEKDLYLNGSLVEKLVIPEGITEIDDCAFAYCGTFNSVYFPSSLKKIGKSAFARTSISSIYVNSISDFIQIECDDWSPFGDESWNLFVNNELVTNLTIPEGTQKISSSLFEKCKSIQKLYIPGTIKRLGSHFNYCQNLTEVYIEEGVEEIVFSFYECGDYQSNVTVYIPSSVSYIDRQCFDVAGTAILECIENSYAHDYAERLSQDTDLRFNVEYHIFDDEYDCYCNLCDYMSHSYNGSCDAECDLCGYTRTTTHTYDNDNDLICNICKCSRSPNKPTAATISATSIELEMVDGCEYSIDGIIWQDEPLFENLIPDTEYNFYQRVKETTLAYESDKSEPLIIKTSKITITYNANGGTAAPKAQLKDSGIDITLTNDKPNRAGYTFVGWSTKKTGDVEFKSGATYQKDEDTILYAIWRLSCEDCGGAGKHVSSKSCQSCSGRGYFTSSSTSYTCNSCGGYATKVVQGYPASSYYKCSKCGPYISVSSSTSTSSYDCSSCVDGKITTSTTCQNCNGVGYIPLTVPEAPKAPTISQSTENSITLVATENAEYSLDGINWQTSPTFTNLEKNKNYTIYQRLCETETTYQSEPSIARRFIILSAGDLDNDGEPTDWDGVLLMRYLAGWNVNVSESVLDIDGDGDVTDWDGVMFDRYLAGWSVEVFVGTGKAVSICSIKYTDDKNATNENPTSYKTGQKLKLLPLEKEHYIFDGWYYMGDIITELSGNENGDITLIAQWTPVKYNVTYLDTRNNTNSLNPKYITADDGTLTLFDLPATNGYAFNGWVDSSGKKVTSIVATGQEIKLTATWVFDSVAIIDTKHNYNTKKYEVSYTYASEMGATGNFTVTYQVSIKNVWDYQITTGSVWFQLVDENGVSAGSSFSASVVFLPVGDTYTWEYEMNAVPKGEYTLIISD